MIIRTTIFAILCCASPLAAQSPIVIYGEPHHDSTFQGNVQRTYGRMLEGLGRGALDYAQALKTLEEVRALRLKAHEDYLLQHRELRERAAAERESRARSRRATPEQLRKWASQSAPQRLAADQLEGGTIHWDPLLLDAAGAAWRAEVEAYLADAARGECSRIPTRQAQCACERLLDGLKARITTLRPTEYLRARKFLVSLQHEVHLGTSAVGG